MFRAKPQDGIAWITGASAGIGRAVALRLAAEGYRVAVTARRADLLAALAAEAPDAILPYPGDVTDRAGLAHLVAAIERDHGPIALALLNAGVYDPGERSGFDAEMAWRTMTVNVGGVFNGLDPLLTAMLGRGGGQIALVGSLAGHRGIPGSLAYGASKAALIYVAEALHLTYAPLGIRVQIVNPGFVRTAMTAANDYPMPLMIGADAAAATICTGLRRGGFEITFPRRLAWAAKATRILPHRIFFPLMARAASRAYQPDAAPRR